MLRERDPQAAARIEASDSSRVMRALEVLEAAAGPSSLTAGRAPPAEGSFLLIALTRERGELYRRIDERVQAMFSRGSWRR